LFCGSITGAKAVLSSDDALSSIDSDFCIGGIKLELTWIGKERRPKLEPRILLEDPEQSYHVAHRVGERELLRTHTMESLRRI
jgi:hypothetical protein